MMPRPRKPTALLEANGAFLHDPQRREARAKEPKPDPSVGNAPRHLNKTQQTIWREVMDQIPPNVATKADRLVIEVAVRMVERMRHPHIAEGDNACKPGCPGEMRSSDYATLNRCLGQLGMNPADRSKIKVAEAPQVDEWEEDFGAVN